MTRIHAAVTLALLCSSHALQPDVIKASGQRTSEAILRDLNQGVKLVNELHTLAAAGKFHDAKGETKGFPDLHRAIEVEIEKVYNSEIGSGGVYSGYYAEERGVMNGVLVPNNRYHVWVGHPPSSPELSCTNPKVRSTCHTPPGTAKGYLETWEMLEDSDHYEKSGLFQNTSYDPRMHEWYHPQQEALHITKPYVFKPDSYSSSIGITLSRGVHKDGKPIGVVAVDVDLSSLDMIIGPLRPGAGSEVVLCDPSDAKVIVSTFTASRQVRWTHKKVSCFDQPFLPIFGHIVNTVGNLHRAQGGAVMLHTNEQSKLLRWNSIYSMPVHVGDGQTWLLVLTDDSENRSESAGSLAVSTLLIAFSALLCTLL